MKAKKLVGLLLALCFIFLESVSPVLAGELPEVEGKDANAKEETSKKEEAAASEEESAILVEEVTNVEDTFMESISFALTATMVQEQEKLPKYTEEELMYLSCIIYCEAGNQSTTGKIAVANVVMNRVSSDLFDHVTTIKEAIYDCARWGRQFSPVYVRSSNGKWTTNGSAYEKALTMYKTGSYAKDWQKTQMEACIEAARSALEGEVVIPDFLYFNMGISSGKAKCEKNGTPYKVIGCHIFY